MAEEEKTPKQNEKEPEIEPLSDEALEDVAGGASSDGPSCCSCDQCSNGPGTA